jgi:hypothetical protein
MTYFNLSVYELKAEGGGRLYGTLYIYTVIFVQNTNGCGQLILKQAV